MLRGAMWFDRSHISVELINDVTMVVRSVAPNVPAQITGSALQCGARPSRSSLSSTLLPG